MTLFRDRRSASHRPISKRPGNIEMTLRRVRSPPLIGALGCDVIPFVQRCLLRIRMRLACAWLSWRLAGSSSVAPHERQRRPSLKAFLQGSTGVYGVDGRLVVMMRRPHDRLAMEDRQLSFNCPRYITVGFDSAVGLLSLKATVRCAGFLLSKKLTFFLPTTLSAVGVSVVNIDVHPAPPCSGSADVARSRCL